MEITGATLKRWSIVGSRAAFGLAAVELGDTYDDLMVLTGDVVTSAGLERFRENHPEKLVDVGIAEQNMIGVAAGFASEGYRVITVTFAPFQTMRCCEQIRVNLGYMEQKVCLVGLASGIVLGTLGYTHCCVEDLGVLRSIPNLTIISPADCGETVKATLAAVNHNQSVYIRLTGEMKNPRVYEEDYDFEIGKAITLREGDEITIIATGMMVHQSLKAADLLAEKGISATVVNMHTIKPIDRDVIEQACQSSKLIATVEEHNIIGGLGSAVAECKTAIKDAPPQLLIGIDDCYGKAGNYKYQIEMHELTAQQIADKILNRLEQI